MFYPSVPPERYITAIENKVKELEKLESDNLALKDRIEDLSKAVLATGLTTEELQGIHGLIGMQIKLISELQSQVESDTDVIDLANPINALVSLASLVSKPTG